MANVKANPFLSNDFAPVIRRNENFTFASLFRSAIDNHKIISANELKSMGMTEEEAASAGYIVQGSAECSRLLGDVKNEYLSTINAFSSSSRMDFVRGNGSDYNHFYRELYIYKMIEYFDTVYHTNYETENFGGFERADGVSAHTMNLTPTQKKLYRNDICNRIQSHVRDYNTRLALDKMRGNRTDERFKSVYDEDVIVKAFFEGYLCKAYKDFAANDYFEKVIKPDWAEAGKGVRGKIDADARAWTIDNNTYTRAIARNGLNYNIRSKANNAPLALAISPCDPLFEHTTFGEGDTLGMIVAPDDSHVDSYFERADDGTISDFKNCVMINSRELTGDATGASMYSITDLFSTTPGGRSAVVNDILSRIGASDGSIKASALNSFELDENPMRYVSTYIKDKKSRRIVTNYFNRLKEDAPRGSRISFPNGMTREQKIEQYKFMADVCKYFDGKGMSYTMEYDDYYKTLNLKLTRSKIAIRLLDPGHPSQRGHIYDFGRMTYLSSSDDQKTTVSYNGESIPKSTYYDLTMSNELPMNMIKYYFGDSVKVKGVNGDYSVGQDAVVRYTDSNGKTQTSSLVRLSTSAVKSDRNSFVIGIDPVTNDEIKIVNDTTRSRKWSESLYAPISRKTSRVQDNKTFRFRSVDEQIKSGNGVVSNDMIDDWQSSIMVSSDITSGIATSDDGLFDSYTLPLKHRHILLESDIIRSEADARKEYPNIPQLSGALSFGEDGRMTYTMTRKNSDTTYSGYLFKKGISDLHSSYYKHCIAANVINDYIDSAKQGHARLMNLKDMLDHFDVNSTMDSYDVRSTDKQVEALRSEIWKKILIGRKDLSIEERKKQAEVYYASWLNTVIGRNIAIPKPKDSEFAFPAEAKQYNDNGSFSPAYVAKYAMGSMGSGMNHNTKILSHCLMAMEDDYSPKYIQDDSVYHYDDFQANRGASLAESEDIDDFDDEFDDDKGDYDFNEGNNDDSSTDKSSLSVLSNSQQLRAELMRYDPAIETKFDLYGSVRAYKGMSATDIPSASDVIDYLERMEKGEFAQPNTRMKPVFNVTGMPYDVVKMRPFTCKMVATAARSMIESGCSIDSIELAFDRNGVFKYSAKMPDSKKSSARTFHDVSGYIGHVIEPGKYGELNMRNMTGKVIVPGYRGKFEGYDSLNPVPLGDRLRVYGYESDMRDEVSRRFKSAVTAYQVEYNFNSHTADLDSVYKGLVSTRYPVSEFYERIGEGVDIDSLSKEERDNIMLFRATVDTNSRSVRFDTELIALATSDAQAKIENPYTEEGRQVDIDSFNNNGANMRTMPIELTGGSSLVMDPRFVVSRRRICPFSTGTGNKQGITVCLAANAIVNSITHEVTPSLNPNDCSPLVNTPFFKTCREHDPFDRTQMVYNNMKDAVYMYTSNNAYLTSEAVNHDDALAISLNTIKRTCHILGKSYDVARFTKNGAEPDVGVDGKGARVYVRDKHGRYMRGAYVNDKLSNSHGNKGTVGRVVIGEYCRSALQNAFNLAQKNKSGDFDPANYVEARDRSIGAKDKKNGDPMSVADALKGNSDRVQFIFYGNDPYRRKSLTISNLRSKCKRANMAPMDYIISEFQKVHRVNEKESALFYSSKPVDALVSPLPGLSRGNSGWARDNLDSVANGNGNPLDFVNSHTGKRESIMTGCETQFLLNKHSDDKSHYYHGRGRNFSAMGAQILIATGCYKTMNVIYGDNVRGFDDLRIYMLSLGLDLTETLKPTIGYHRHVNENMRLLGLPTDSYLNGNLHVNMNKVESAAMSRGKNPAEDVVSFDGDTRERIRADFDRYLEAGGFMELPFELDYRSGDVLGKNGKTGESLKVTTVRTSDDPPRYGLYTIPYNKRSDRELGDEQVTAHDYTERYRSIYRAGCIYRKLQMEHDSLSASAENDGKRKALDRLMSSVKRSAQEQLDFVTSDIRDHKMTSKHGTIRSEILSVACNDSATMNCGPDNKLGLEEVAMSKESASKLGLVDKSGQLKQDAHVLVWRDPLLNTGNMRYMKVVIDNNIPNGIKIHATNGKSFDGDYDGDTYGVVNIAFKEDKVLQDVHDELVQNLSTQANMVNLYEQDGVWDTPDNQELNGRAKLPLYFNFSLECAANMFYNDIYGDGSLKKQYDELTRRANEVHYSDEKLLSDPNALAGFRYTAKGKDGESVEKTGMSAVLARRMDLMHEVDDFARNSVEGVGVLKIDFTNVNTCLKSIEEMYICGAKGNAGKLKDFAKNLGVTYETEFVTVGEYYGLDRKEHPDKFSEDAKIEVIKQDTVREVASPRLDKEHIEECNQKDQDVAENCAARADMTKWTGSGQQAYAILCINFRPRVLNASMSCSSSSTQAALQAKKNPADAAAIGKQLHGYGKDVQNGIVVTNMDDPNMSVDDIRKIPHISVTVVPKSAAGQKYKNEGRFYDTPKDDNTPVRIRMKQGEWATSMETLMVGRNVPFNAEHIKIIEDIMTYPSDPNDPNSQKLVLGLEQSKKRYGSLLMLAGYDGMDKFKHIVSEAAKSSDVEKRSLIDGLELYKLDTKSDEYREMRAHYHKDFVPNTRQFVPDQIKHSVEAYNQDHYSKDIIPLGPKDMSMTRDDYAKVSDRVKVMGGWIDPGAFTSESLSLGHEDMTRTIDEQVDRIVDESMPSIYDDEQHGVPSRPTSAPSVSGNPDTDALLNALDSPDDTEDDTKSDGGHGGHGGDDGHGGIV